MQGNSEDATGAIAYLTKPEQYARVYADSKSWYSDVVVLRATPNGLPQTRCGFSVGKKVGKAVVRNRVKRLLREVSRSTSLNPGWDVVLIARQKAATATYADINASLKTLFTRAKLLGNTPIVNSRTP